MASVPTAYASQRFGRKTLDFYSVEGDVVGADPRARSDERRLQDFDGARHTVRLIAASFQLEPGDSATVLRMQPGPAQRSRPVAVVNHDRRGWTRTHPGAAGLLARAGISRTVNWTLSMALFALAALALVWPMLRAFLIEVDPALFGAAPRFDIGDWVAAYAPVLTSWSFTELAAPLTGQIAAAAPGLAPTAPALVFGAGVLIAALGVYVLRSWRLLWAPLFVLALGAAAIGYGGVEGMTGPALAGLGLAASVFLIGGLINRIRDAARLEGRIALLADHVLRQGPQEGAVEARDAEPGDENDDAADTHRAETLAPAIAASATALREPGDDRTDDSAEAGDGDDDAEPADAGPETADTETGPGTDGTDAEPGADTPLESAANDSDAAAPAQAGAAEPESADAQTKALDQEPAPETAEAQGEAAAPADVPQSDSEAPDTNADIDGAAAQADADTQETRDGAVTPPQAPEADDAAPQAEAEAPAPEPAAPEDEAPEAASEAATEDAPEDAPEAAPSDADASVDGADAGAEPDSQADEDSEAGAAEAPAPAAQAGPADEAVVADGEAEPPAEADPTTVAPLSGEAERPQSDLDAGAPAGLEPEEAERLRTDPRYASRAIVLPPPPPMPEPAETEKPQEAAAARAPTARTLKPSAPLPGNVVPIFAALAPSRKGAAEAAGAEAPEDDDPDGGERA